VSRSRAWHPTLLRSSPRTRTKSRCASVSVHTRTAQVISGGKASPAIAGGGGLIG
jgi:hypothetical protein